MLWEYIHKWSGRIALLLGLANIGLGLMLMLAPRGLYIAWFVVLGIWVAANVLMEIRLHRFPPSAPAKSIDATGKLENPDSSLLSPAGEPSVPAPKAALTAV